MRKEDVKTVSDLMAYALERDREPKQAFNNRGVDWRLIRDKREREANGRNR